jgi:uroporphyrin-III C-methyltransferase
MRPGTVALVGAGPGHADFLTLGALKAIQKADVILYDALLGRDILDLFPTQAQAIYVGKRCGVHALRQEQINELLVHYARQGLDVVRLKGGDPFVFGRGAEELTILREHGIPYHIVPGISSLNGIAAQYALPVTSRTHSNEFRAIQGHSLSGDPSYWHGLATYQGTLIIFMGLENLPLIVERLRTFGAERRRPLAIIETASDGQTHLTRSTLGLVQQVGFERKTRGPGIVYIGANVELMDAQALAHYQQSEETADVIATAHFS